MFKYKKLTTFLCILFFSTSFFYSQEALKSIEEDYYDFLSLTGVLERPTLGYRTLSDSVWELSEESEHIWAQNYFGKSNLIWESPAPVDNLFTNGLFQGFKYKIFGPEWFNSFNSYTPYGQNDGALWQGKGYNTSLTGGARLEGYGFELTFKPQISFSQNISFKYLPGVFGDPHSYFAAGNIDLVQRFGDKSFWNYDWGDSEIRWTWNSLTFGFGTQNPWLGPAYINPMLGSNNSGGYLKFDAGLRETKVYLPFIDWYAGSIEGRIWVGQLQESDYFDNDSSNNKRMLTAMSASYKPSFIPGLTLGLNRIFLTYWRTENFAYILRLFTASRLNALASSGNDEDQKFALYVDWNFPKAGFRFYGEMGRDDFSYNENTNPYHTAIYTAGIEQVIPFTSNITSELVLEWNGFEMSQDFQLQWPYLGFYAHGFVKQGYTHKGQILGAGSGFFGNSQFVKYKVYYPKGYSSFKFHRHSPNNNWVLSKAVNASANSGNSDLYTDWYSNYETYFCYSLENCYYVLDNLHMVLDLSYIRIHYPLYSKGDQKSNIYVSFLMKYNF